MRWAEITVCICMSTSSILTVVILVRCNHMALLRLRSWVLCHPGWILDLTEHQNYQRDVSFHSTCSVIIELSPSNYTTLSRRSVCLINSINSQLSALSILDFYLIHFHEQASGRVNFHVSCSQLCKDSVSTRHSDTWPRLDLNRIESERKDSTCIVLMTHLDILDLKVIQDDSVPVRARSESYPSCGEIDAQSQRVGPLGVCVGQAQDLRRTLVH